MASIQTKARITIVRGFAWHAEVRVDTPVGRFGHDTHGFETCREAMLAGLRRLTTITWN